MKKKFINDVFKFLGLLLFALVVANFTLKTIVNHRCSYKLQEKHSTIILGHSQPEHAFNDSLIQNTKNLCNGGEAYIYTYQKLKKLISENSQIKIVLVSFSNNQIENKMTNWTFDENNMNQYYSKLSFMMDIEDYFLFIKHSFRNLLIAELKGMVLNSKSIYKAQNRIENTDFGGYLYSKREKVDSLIAKKYNKNFEKTKSNKISEVNINYLKKIVTLCNDKNLKLVFFRTPIHSLLFQKLDENKFQQIRKANFDTIPFIDLHDFPINNSEFGDFMHLNYKGAIKVSHHLNAILLSKIYSINKSIK
jgi:hypothetical protein